MTVLIPCTPIPAPVPVAMGEDRLGWKFPTDFGAKGDGTTDDSAAVQATIDACASAGGGVVFFPAGIYLVANAPTTRTGMQIGGVATTSTAQLWLPNRHIEDTAGVTIEMAGPTMAHRTPSLIGSTPAPLGGAVLKSTCTTAGAAILGGISTSTTYPWTNVTLALNNLRFQAPPNPVISGLDLSYICAVDLDGVSVDTGAYAIDAIAEPVTAGSYGILLPRNSNGAWSIVRRCYVLGFYNGTRLTEHADIDASAFFGCKVAMLLPKSDHALKIGRVLIQECTVGIKAAGDGVSRFVGQQVDFEDKDAGYWYSRATNIDDPGNLLSGRVLVAVTRGGVGAVNTLVVNGATNLQIEILGTAGIVNGAGGHA